jgi:long-chain fatty acid transport protein
MFLSLLAVLSFTSFASAQNGAQLTGVGAINRSMGGTSTAAPLDTLGAFLWNPATISDLPDSADMSVELLFPHSKLSSTAGPLSGSTNSNSGVFPLPDMGIVFQPGSWLPFGLEEMPITLGLGVLTTGGFGSNFPGSTTNPILTAPPPHGIGVGPIFAQYVMTQIIPTISIQTSERLSIGFSPIIDLANLSVDPGVFAPPNPSGYPPLNNGTYQWGAGFQAGAFYKMDNYWQLGASFKSPQWFNEFQFNSRDQNGSPQSFKVPVNGPMIVSLGTAYTGYERLLLALDVRYLDYNNTQPFSASGISSTGVVNGLGWSSIFALSTGAQYQWTNSVSLRAGYSFNTNPISNGNTFLNAATPLDIQQGIYCGGSWNLTERFKVSLAYAHFFANTISGPWISPVGPIPGTSVTATSSADSIIASASFLF